MKTIKQIQSLSWRKETHNKDSGFANLKEKKQNLGCGLVARTAHFAVGDPDSLKFEVVYFPY